MWVADHPAHLHLVASLRERGSSDLLIAVHRPEVDRMIDASGSRLEGLDLLRVPRVIGRGRVRVAWKRYRSVVRILREARSEGRPFRRMVAKQAPIELIAARRAGIRDRFLLLDTESDRASIALGRWSQPTVIVPESWDASRVGPHWTSGDRLRRMPGTFSHIGLSAEEEVRQPILIVRRLLGDGVHDRGEVVGIPEDLIERLRGSMTIEWADEPVLEGDPWAWHHRLRTASLVLTSSTTMALECGILGTPVVLWSAATRATLDAVIASGAPILQTTDMTDVLRWEPRPTRPDVNPDAGRMLRSTLFGGPRSEQG